MGSAASFASPCLGASDDAPAWTDTLLPLIPTHPVDVRFYCLSAMRARVFMRAHAKTQTASSAMSLPRRVVECHANVSLSLLEGVSETDPVLLYALPSRRLIRSLRLEPLHSSRVAEPAERPLGTAEYAKPLLMSYDYVDNAIYYVDDTRRQIGRAFRNGSSPDVATYGTVLTEGQ